MSSAVHPGVPRFPNGSGYSGYRSAVLTVALPDLDNPDRWHPYQCNAWSGPATLLDGGARLWGYTAEILIYMSKHLRL